MPMAAGLLCPAKADRSRKSQREHGQPSPQPTTPSACS